MSAFIKEQIEKGLKDLRYKCGLQRLYVRNASGVRWARNSRSSAENERDSGSSDKYWDDKQAESLSNSTAGVIAADKALAEFIVEHRPLMDAIWPGTDHGRLCWSPFLGGLPIDQHYCQKLEQHDGPHGNEIGDWPPNVTDNYQWRRLQETLPSGTTGLEQSTRADA